MKVFVEQSKTTGLFRFEIQEAGRKPYYLLDGKTGHVALSLPEDHQRIATSLLDGDKMRVVSDVR